MWKCAVVWVANVIVTALMAVGIAIVLMEWVAGCGETYTDAKGVTHVHECIFIR